jgi:NAD(P)-dependent dehydrogenase (short-subunit alcohol dehydrogenase family)
MLDVNLLGPVYCTRAVLPAMLAAGRGRIVNIASMSGLTAYARTTAYTASKHGLVGLTRALALEVRKHAITVNAVCPGYTDTDMALLAERNLMAALNKSAEEARAIILRRNPRGTLIQPAEVARVVAWLSTDATGAINGQAIPVAGGET